MAEFEINGVEFQTKKLDPFTQFDVMKSLAPLMGAFRDFGSTMQKNMPTTPIPGLDDPDALKAAEKDAMVNLGFSFIDPLAKALAEIKREDARYIFGICLSATKMNQGGVWVPIWNAQANAPQFDTIDLPVMLQISWHVLRENFESFFGGLLSTLGRLRVS